MVKQPKIYVGGSLRSDSASDVANFLRSRLKAEVFDDWQATSPDADDAWKAYERERGRTFLEALRGHAARNVFEFDKKHLDESDAFVLVLPAGRSAHMELGYMAGNGKPTFILYNPEVENDRWDVMYGFATAIVDNQESLVYHLRSHLPHVDHSG